MTAGERLTPARPEATTVLEDAERHREADGRPILVGRFWGPPGTVGTQGVAAGPVDRH